MTSSKSLRWYLLLVAFGALLGVLSRHTPDASPSIATDAKWVPAAPIIAKLDERIPMRIASMSWWGTKSADMQESPGRISVDSDGLAKIKVDWLFRGVIEESKGRFALIAKDAASPVQRYSRGAILPGGERLERIDAQGIRFSLSEDGEGREFERKLYAPLE